MMLLYSVAIYIYGLVARVVALWSPKARFWSDGRKNILEKIAQAIPSSERIVWVHVASLGEFEQGRPIIEKIRRENPEYKILVTFFSPSGYEIRHNYEGADYIFYLPNDTPRNAKRFLDIVNPEIAIFVKYEFWLNYLSELRARKIRSFIVSAIFRRNSIFFRPWGFAWRNALEAYESIFVQDENSKSLLAEWGFDNTIVAGDTRFDRVWDITQNSKDMPIIERFKGDSELFVAGSSWSEDEDILLPLIERNPNIKFLVAPHEIGADRIEKLHKRIGDKSVKYSECDNSTPMENIQVVILDTMGMLSSAYKYGSFGYIGGGFGRGIHNTLEAATFGLPIAFGPNYSKFKEACDLISFGVAKSVCSAAELEEWFTPLTDSDYRKAISLKCTEFMAHSRGATNMIVKTIFKS